MPFDWFYFTYIQFNLKKFSEYIIKMTYIIIIMIVILVFWVTGYLPITGGVNPTISKEQIGSTPPPNFDLP